MVTDSFIPPIFDQLHTDWFVPKRVGETLPHRRMLGLVHVNDLASDVPRKMRTKHAPVFQLTERDTNVLRALHRLRILDRRQIERLFFPNFSLTCERLRKLYLHGYVERIYRPPKRNGAARGPAYRLGARGAKFLADEQGIALSEFSYWGKHDDRRHHKTERTHVYIEHALALADFRLAVEQQGGPHCQDSKTGKLRWVGLSPT